MAEQSSAAKHRARQTLINLVLALGATVAIALILVMIVPRDDSNLIKPVDYKPIAASVKASAGIEVFAPNKLPDGWWVNSARWAAAPADGVQYWHIGFVGPKNQYVGVDQAFKSNATWIANRITGFEQKTVSADGIGGGWGLATYQGSTDKTKGQKIWLFLHFATQEAVLIQGTGKDSEFTQFANMLGFTI